MSFARLFYLSGIALLSSALIALLVSVIGTIAFPTTGLIVPANEPEAMLWVPLWSASFIGTVLFLLGLPGMYLSQARRAGMLGLLSLLVTVVGYFFLLVVTFFYIDVLPFLAQKAPLTLKDTLTPTMSVFALGAGLLQTIGLILLGIVTIRAKFFPRLAGIFLLIGGLLNPATIGTNLVVTLIGLLSTLATSLGLGWIGYSIARSAWLALHHDDLSTHSIERLLPE